VGGLGKSKTRAEISQLSLDTVTFNGATNGVRIKSWQVSFQHFGLQSAGSYTHLPIMWMGFQQALRIWDAVRSFCVSTLDVKLESTNTNRYSLQGSTGYANNFEFKNIKMINTKNPILIDQYYCDSGSSGSCTNYTNSVLISDIKYRNITGTSATKKAVVINCSETVACTGISLQDINLVQTSGSATTSNCVDAYGSASGTMIPPSCLAS
jgi:hypothetical protein